MPRRRSAPALVALALLASAVAAVAFETMPVPQPPILLRLDATIAPTAAAARGKGFTVVSLGFPGREATTRRWLAVEDARTVGPDTALDGKDVLALVAPHQPNLLVTGPATLVDPVLAAAPGTRVRLEGLVLRGSGTYYLRTVRVGADAWDAAS